MQRYFVPNEIELERDVQKELLAWKQKRHHTILQIEGPRQVGKTHEIRKFADRNYEQVIYVNLVRDEFGFEDSMDEPEFMEKYCEKSGVGKFQDHENTILIIDEIQERPEVYNAIRDLRERLHCDIAVSGSYLARTIHSKDYFLPAGIAYLKIFPLSFREFCRAFGLEEAYMQLDLKGRSDQEDYNQLEKLYRVYRHIGGFPQVVTTYIRWGEEADCLDVLEDLIRTFTDESSRFFSNSTALTIFHEVYRSVFQEMTREKKGSGRSMIEEMTDFVKDSVKEPVSRNEVRSAASWLFYSGIIGYCDLYNNGDVTDLVSNRRVYFMDTGIANYISGLTTVPQSDVDGLLTEIFVYNELNRFYQKVNGDRMFRGDKPCFSICGNYELDFLAVLRTGHRVGIEVKTGVNKPRSLMYYKEHGLIDKAFRASPSKGGHGEMFDTIPIYLVGRKDVFML